MNQVVINKPRKEVIQRTINYYEIQGNKKRIITVAYKYNRITKQLTYGATVFRTDLKNPETYNSEAHQRTATQRFTKKPVIIENFTDESTLNDFHKKIRKQLFTYKVCANNSKVCLNE